MSNVQLSQTGSGEVVLLAGGGRVYTDVAARFCHSTRTMDDILASPYNKKLVERILDSGHLAATEFDYFLFGVSGYSRVTETQLVRSRMASYMISSGRNESGGKRDFDVTLPPGVMDVKTDLTIRVRADGEEKDTVLVPVDAQGILQILSQWYDAGVRAGVPEEDLRYLKPQGTTFRAIIGMNAHSLLHFFQLRCCNRAQHEIRDMANKMLALCKKAKPDLFFRAGAPCRSLGYCPEGEQCAAMKGRIPTKSDVDERMKGWVHDGKG